MVLRFIHNPGYTLFSKTAKAIWVIGGKHLTWAMTLFSLHVGGQMILALFYLCVGRYGSIEGVVGIAFWVKLDIGCHVLVNQEPGKRHDPASGWDLFRFFRGKVAVAGRLLWDWIA